jgi:hypothetical protein
MLHAPVNATRIPAGLAQISVGKSFGGRRVKGPTLVVAKVDRAVFTAPAPAPGKNLISTRDIDSKMIRGSANAAQLV